MNITEAQTTTINQVGILSPMDANGEKDVWDAFKDGLTELGYSEGKDVTFVSRFADGNYDRYLAPLRHADRCRRCLFIGEDRK
jgi:hypothetical protein